MARNFSTNLIIGGKLNPSLANAFNRASKMANQSSLKFSSLGRIAGKVMGAVGIAVSGAALADVAKEGIELASSLTEVQNVVDTTFGKNAGQIDKWSGVALKSFGLSELQAKKYTSTLGAMMKSSGIAGKNLTVMSEKLAGLSGDFASFYNVAQDDAFGDLQSAMAGQTETMLKYGINMQVANLEQFALSKGIKTSYNNMDQASKVALRYAYIMEKSKDAQGDFVKTQGSYANQTRLLKTNVQQMVSKLMTGLLPALTDIAKKGNDIINKFTGDPARLQAMQDRIQGIADKIGDGFDAAADVYSLVKDNYPVIEPIIWGITTATVSYKAATLGLVAAQKAGLIIESLSKAWQSAAILLTWLRQGESLATVAQIGLNAAMAANPIGVVAVAIMALIAAGVLLYKNWDKISAAAGRLWKGVKGAFGAGINWVIGKLNSMIEKINLIPGIDIPLIAKIQTTGEKTGGIRRGFTEYAEGGIASVPSIFGEKGPEIAIPLKRTPRSMSLLNQATQILGGRGGNSIQVIYSPQVSGSSRPEIEQALKVNYEMFKAWLEQYFADKEALSFGNV